MVATGQLTMSTVLLLPIVFLFDDPPRGFGIEQRAVGDAVAGAAVVRPRLSDLLRLISGPARPMHCGDLPQSRERDPARILLLHETLEPHQIAGMAAIFLALQPLTGARRNSSQTCASDRSAASR